MTEPKKYRKKPVEIEAMQMPTVRDFDAVHAIALWMVSEGYEANPDGEDLTQWSEEFVIKNSDGSLVGLPGHGVNYLDIVTLEGEMGATHGDWIIKGVAGEFYPCKPEIFEQTYEAVS